MTTLARRHRMRVLAATAGTTHTALSAPDDVQRLMLARLVGDLRRLHEIQSIERKIAIKAELMPDYADYIDGVLAGDAGGEDEVLTTLMVWHLDTLDFARALTIAQYVMRHGLRLPTRYNRDVATLLLDEVSNAVLAGRVELNEATLAALQQVAALTDDRDAPDQARAKLYRAIGETLAALAEAQSDDTRAETLRTALQALERALALHAGVGAKKAIEQLKRKIKQAGLEPRQKQPPQPPRP